MPQREEVRFAKEKDKTWLGAGSNDHFHKDPYSNDICMVACFAISPF